MKTIKTFIQFIFNIWYTNVRSIVVIICKFKTFMLETYATYTYVD